MLHTQSDLNRMRTRSPLAPSPGRPAGTASSETPTPPTAGRRTRQSSIIRGSGCTENYATAYNDIAAACRNALYWHIAGDTAHAAPQPAAAILEQLGLRADGHQPVRHRRLLAGRPLRLPDGERRRDHADLHLGGVRLRRVKTMMTTVFYAMNHDFLVRHNGACISHYWANWDLCNMDSMLAIGVLTDDRANGTRRSATSRPAPATARSATRSSSSPATARAVAGERARPGPQHPRHRPDGRAVRDGLEAGRRSLRLRQQSLPRGGASTSPVQPRQRCPLRDIHLGQRQRDHAGIADDDLRDRAGSDRPSWELVYNHYVNGRQGRGRSQQRGLRGARRPRGRRRRLRPEQRRLRSARLRHADPHPASHPASPRHLHPDQPDERQKPGQRQRHHQRWRGDAGGARTATPRSSGRRSRRATEASPSPTR